MTPASRPTSSAATPPAGKPEAPPAAAPPAPSFAEALTRANAPSPAGSDAPSMTSPPAEGPVASPAGAAENRATMATPGPSPTAETGEDGPAATSPLHPRTGREGEAARARPHADPLDPAARHAAQLAPPILPLGTTPPTAPTAAPAEAQAHASLESMLPELVRKIAWSGDGKKGSMRLELGAGALAGGTLVVHADEGRVRVELSTPTGTDVDAWRERLQERLERRGVAVDEVSVE